MAKFIIFFKTVVLVFIFIINIIIFYNIFFSEKEQRFGLAGDFQGTYFSDFVFSVLNVQYPDYSDAFMERSVGFNKIGKYDKGFFYLDEAVKLDPSLHLGYRGWLKYEYLRDYDGAIKDFIKLDKLTPNFVDYPWGVNIHQLLGNCYAAKKEYKKALIEYNKYLKLTNEKEYTGDFFMFYGKALENSNRLEDALNSYSRSIKVDSLRADHHFYKGVLLFKLKRYSEAKKYIDNSLDLYNKRYYYADSYNELYMQINKDSIFFYQDTINSFINK